MNNASLSTKALWNNTHGALCTGRWTVALACLDTLTYRNDNRDLLCELGAYMMAAGTMPDHHTECHLRSRLLLVNANVRTPRIPRDNLNT